MIVRRKLCRDEDEVIICFHCRSYIYKGDLYVLVISESAPDPEDGNDQVALGICIQCAKKIGEATT